jgi:hypothetical protein
VDDSRGRGRPDVITGSAVASNNMTNAEYEAL